VVAGRDDDDALVGAIRPVGEAAAGELARRLLPADALIEAIHPERFAVRRIDRERDSARRRDGEQAAVRVQRRGAVVLVVAERGRAPLPRDGERIEVRRVDLIER
jgi:hypothetical protein